MAAALGGVTGAVLLLALPASAFERVVPFLILLACALVALQPRLSRALAPAARRRGALARSRRFVYLNGIYGGYFGAAQGVILIALLAIFVPDGLQRLNGLKNVLTLLVNGVAAVLFIALAPVSWPVVVLAIAAGSIAGGQIGAAVGRRLPPLVLRGIDRRSSARWSAVRMLVP